MGLDGNMIGKMLRFSVVGIAGAVIDFGFTYLCKEILKINKFISNAIGFTLAATFCFFLNKYWTYQSQSPLAWKEYLIFIFAFPFRSHSTVELMPNPTNETAMKIRYSFHASGLWLW